MNQANAKEFLPIVQALAEGNTIQYNDDIRGWIDVDCIESHWHNPEWYRIKPEPKELDLWVSYFEDGSICSATTTDMDAHDWPKIRVRVIE